MEFECDRVTPHHKLPSGHGTPPSLVVHAHRHLLPYETLKVLRSITAF